MIKKYFFQKHNLVLFSFFLFSFSFAQTTQTYDQPGTYAFTVPAGVTSIKVQAWGAGSGGNNDAGRGGGGGAFAGNNSLSVSPGSTYTVTVGSGGARGTGNSGQESRFANLVIAKGGSGANGGSAASSTGVIKFSGGNGGSSDKKAGAGGGGSGGAEGSGGNGENPGKGNKGGKGGDPGDGGGAQGGAGGDSKKDGIDGSFPGGGGGERGEDGGSSGAGGGGQVIISYTPISYLAQIISANTGSSTWCAGETRNVSVTIKNIGNQPWTDGGGKDFNIGVKWNQNGTSWNDYNVRVDAGNLLPGETKTYNFTIKASNYVNGTYGAPLTAGTNNLTFDVVFEGKAWFAWNNNGVGPGNTIFKTPNQTISALPSVPTLVTPNSGVSICYGNSTTIKATSAGNVIDWYTSSNGGIKIGTSNSGADFSVSPIVNTVYYAEARNGSGCVSASRTATAEIKINSSPVATVTSNNQICAGADAIFTLTGTPGAQVTYTINGGSPLTVSLTGGEATVTVPSSSVDQNLKIIAVSKGSCTNSTEVSATVTVGAESVYANGVWSKGRPSDNGLNAVIAGNYNTADGNIKACNCTVQAGGVLTVSKGTVLKIENALVNNGTLTVESDGNIIQVNDAAVNSGNILVKRKLTFRSDDRKEYNYLISPVEDANLKTQMYRKADGTAVIAPFVLYHNEANDYFYNSSGAYIKGRALAVKEPTLSSGAIDTAFFQGKPFNGKIDYSLAFSAANRGFNLVGNPYPSNLDLNLLYWQNEKEIDPNIRLWDNSVNDIYVQQGSSYKGYAYALRNEATGNAGVGVPATGRMGSDKGNSKAKMPDRIVNVGQGFMVKAAGAGKVLKYSNSLRSTEQGTVFFGKKAQDDRYWLQLKAPSGIVSTIAIVYFANGNSSFSIDDSRTMGGSDALYSFADNEKVAINGRTTFSIDDKINLGSSHFVKGDYTISIGDREGVFASGQKIYLKDVLTGTITNLSEGDYTFSAGAGESTGRFEIIYKAETVLAVDSQIADELIMYRDGGDFVVKAQSKKITGLELYDTAGRLIYKSNPNSLQVVISGEMLNSGMYVLKTDQNGIVTAKKIIK